MCTQFYENTSDCLLLILETKGNSVNVKGATSGALGAKISPRQIYHTSGVCMLMIVTIKKKRKPSERKKEKRKEINALKK